MRNVPKVLLVDDEPRILRVVRASLSFAGYEVLTTSSGEEAVSLVKSEAPDVILLDVVMQPVDGLEVLKELRTFSQVPVLLFTARNYSADQVRELGANGIIRKPFRSDEMVKSIRAVLSAL